MNTQITIPATGNLAKDINLMAKKLYDRAIAKGFDLLDPKRDNTYKVARAHLEKFTKIDGKITAKFFLVHDVEKRKF